MPRGDGFRELHVSCLTIAMFLCFAFSVEIPRTLKRKRKGKKGRAKQKLRSNLLEVEEGEIVDERPECLKPPPSLPSPPKSDTPVIPPPDSSSDEGNKTFQSQF